MSAIRKDQPPAVVRKVAIATASLGLILIVVNLYVVYLGKQREGFEPIGPFSPDPINYIWAAVAFVAAWMLWNKRRFAPYTAIFVVTVLVGILIWALPFITGPEDVADDASWYPLSFLPPPAAWLWAIVAFGVIALFARALFVHHDSRQYFRIPDDAAAETLTFKYPSSRVHIATTLVAALFVWGLFSYVRFGATLRFSLYGFHDDTWLAEFVYDKLAAIAEFLYHADSVMPIFAGAWMLLFGLTGRYAVNERDIAQVLGLFPIRLLRAPWEKIRRIDFVYHYKHSPSAVVHYRSRFWFPFSFTIHTKGIVNGRELLEQLKSDASSRGVKTDDWFSSDNNPLFALALSASATYFLVYSSTNLTLRAQMYMQDLFPPDRFFELLDPIRSGLLFGASTFCFGMALGVLSAYRQAGPRPVLLVFWLVIGAGWLTPPLISFLTYCSIYAILMARLMPLVRQPEIVIAPLWQAEFMMNIYMLTAAILGFGYFMGIVMGCWPLRPEKKSAA